MGFSNSVGTRQVSRSEKCNASTVSVAAAAATLGLYTIYHQYRKRQKISKPEQLIGNSYASGTDILNVHGRDFIKNRSKPFVIVITGTTSGLGEQTARLLGTHPQMQNSNTTIIMGNRRAGAVESLVKEIAQSGNKAISLPLDLASFNSVKQFASQIKATLNEHNLPKIGLLIHNAGVSFLDGSTKDGFQTVWQVNALSPHLLTELLLPSIDPEYGQVLYVSSEMHYFCWGKSIMDKCPPNPQKGSSSSDYALSKACQILQAYELTTRSNNKIRGKAVEPGLVQTQIGRHAPQWLLQLEYFLLGPFLVRTVDQGCASILYCALKADEEEEKESPTIYFANCKPKRPKAACTNPKEAKKWKELCKELL